MVGSPQRGTTTTKNNHKKRGSDRGPPFLLPPVFRRYKLLHRWVGHQLQPLHPGIDNDPPKHAT
jgi:hypothetical protein